MIFRDFNPEIHDIYKVAELIYDVDYRTFEHVFKSKEEGVEAIKNRLTFEFAEEDGDENELFYVFFDDDDIGEKEIVGMFNGGKGVQHSYFGDIRNQFKHLKFSEALGLSKVSFMDNFVLVDVEEDDFYICEVAICSDKRGKGYGKEALSQLIQLAKDLDCKRVVLDADFRNDGAYRLYKSFGFKVFNRKSFGFPGKKRGMRNMELILNE
ncbi:MAG: GNAT family N-acetyltransferase [Methanobrevibacter sp.]|nr:GNAT family N-acetyltransferase [Methanobrevibacter sp.]